MKFIDEAKIEVIAGKGGNGTTSSRHEKPIPRGSPDSGGSGKSGSAWAEADESTNILVEYRFIKRYQAKNGEEGHDSDHYNVRADDIILKMLVDILICDLDTDGIVADLTRHGQHVYLAKSGKGGLGNIHFKSSISRAPKQSTLGEGGETRSLQLEFKIPADVGLLSMPNTGKSTLITAIFAARPEIANYPSTTLHPSLGTVRIDEDYSLVMADILGLIESAAEGIGLGHRFLKHLSRTGLLLYAVDLAPFGETTNPTEETLAIIDKLRKYDEELYDKPRWFVLNRLGMLDEGEAQTCTAALLEAIGWNYPQPDDRFNFDMITPRLFKVSVLAYQGTQELVHQIGHYLKEKKRIEVEEAGIEQAANVEIAEQQPKTDIDVFKPG